MHQNQSSGAANLTNLNSHLDQQTANGLPHHHRHRLSAPTRGLLHHLQAASGQRAEEVSLVQLGFRQSLATVLFMKSLLLSFRTHVNRSTTETCHLAFFAPCLYSALPAVAICKMIDSDIRPILHYTVAHNNRLYLARKPRPPRTASSNRNPPSSVCQPCKKHP